MADWWGIDRVFVSDHDVSRYTRLGYWSEIETTSTLLARNALEFPRRDAVVDDRGTRLTYAELDDAAARLASGLGLHGVGQGDVVGMQLPNCAEAAIVSYGIERAGGVVCPLVPMFREHELSQIARKCRMKALVTPGMLRDFDHDELASRVAASVPSLRTLISVAPSSDRTALSLQGLLDAAESRTDASLGPNDPSAILFTSGTEAQPKGTIHSNNSLLAYARLTSRVLGLGEADAVFMPSPVGHGTGYIFGLRLALHLGAKLVFQDRWDAAVAARSIGVEECGYMHGATPFVQELVETPEVKRLEYPRFRFFVSGGTTIPDHLAERVREHLGCTLLRLYGQTEAGVITIGRPWDDPAARQKTDGLPLPGVELAVVDDDGVPVGPGIEGEALARGPTTCMGFVADRERALATLTPDGLLKTGDLVRLDERGHLTVCGRKKETISRGGYKYSPREIEEILLTHPSIRQAVIVKMPDDRLGEKGCLFACLAPGAELELESVAAFLRERGVARYKWPERLEVVDMLPMTPSGKVQKFALERQLRC